MKIILKIFQVFFVAAGMAQAQQIGDTVYLIDRVSQTTDDGIQSYERGLECKVVAVPEVGKLQLEDAEKRTFLAPAEAVTADPAEAKFEARRTQDSHAEAMAAQRAAREAKQAQIDAGIAKRKADEASAAEQKRIAELPALLERAEARKALLAQERMAEKWSLSSPESRARDLEYRRLNSQISNLEMQMKASGQAGNAAR